jgi:hypothetical protein
MLKKNNFMVAIRLNVLIAVNAYCKASRVN